MNHRPATTVENTQLYRSGALPAYYLGRSAAIWLASTHLVSSAPCRQKSAAGTTPNH